MAVRQKIEAREGGLKDVHSPTASVAADRPVVGPRERSTGSSAHTPAGCESSGSARAAYELMTSRCHRWRTQRLANVAATRE